MTGDPKWHERTPTLLAASAAALLAIGLVVWLTMVVVRQVNAPAPPPEYVTPTFADESGQTSTTTGSTSTIGSYVPPETSDILVPETTTSSETTTTRTTRERTRTERTRDRDDDDEDEETTTTRRPRQNETRTLYPNYSPP
ncbi:hypothetical protein [Mycolicibacterium bacteremicum]|uniref:hypothetical protein n=1 Tax=Mycolicibacterium bacteremicum TaxID=564198 RepID=UPI0026EB693B|nr:hypothetical protein [Mycolicibacterium bacteremicum]